MSPGLDQGSCWNCPKVAVTCCHTAQVCDVLVEPASQPSRAGLFVMPTFARVEKGQTIVHVVNTTGECAIFRPRSILGTDTSATFDSAIDLSVHSATVSAPSSSPACDVWGERDYGESAAKVDMAKLSLNTDLPLEQRAQVGALRIVVTDDSPVALPHRRIPPAHLKEVEAHLEDLLRRGIIRPSFSRYAAPIVVVRKKDGSLRLCCDYRKHKTRRDSFPLPRTDECLDALGGACHFSTLDLASGYHQVAMEE
ncbi:hypothetical protein EGW08_015092 [Elysia chlorotica]|uniref:Reverse transcriptase domain-containing protein n=1 Tax=Elysia chlorotica TaxID=188477 RepID=A0A3S0ZKQ9_ELYCH|nr:hypothetical protein EGW08_015092 [Elysia chlorotica]